MAGGAAALPATEEASTPPEYLSDLEGGRQGNGRRVILKARAMPERQLLLADNFDKSFDSSFPTAWVGCEALPQLPVYVHRDLLPGSLILVISLFGGIETLLVCLLAMGVSFFAVTAELDADCARGVRACFSNFVAFDKVEAASAEAIDELVSFEKFQFVLIAGGSPCQGESSLNAGRRGLADPRSQLFQFVPRLAADIQQRARAKGLQLRVWSMLENVASFTQGFHTAVSAAFGGEPVITQALDWGWEHRRRKWWIAGQDGALPLSGASLPEDIELYFDGAAWQLRWLGKPLPQRMHFEQGFHPSF